MACSVVDQKEVLGRAASAVDPVIDEVQILGTVSRQIPSPNGTNQRLVAGQCRQTRGGFVGQPQPLTTAVLAKVHVQHGLLVERVDDDHVVPRVAVDVHHIDVPREAWVGDEFRGEVGGHVHQHAFLVHEQEVGFGRFRGRGKRLFADHNHVGPSVLVQVGGPNVLLLVVCTGHACQNEAVCGLDVPLKPLCMHSGEGSCKEQRGESRKEGETEHSMSSC